MPNIGGRSISDITFIDSLTGWAVTPYLAVNDTSFVLKTSNGGDDWFIQHTRSGQFVGSNRVYFLNSSTGFTAGVSNMPAYSAILKTTDGGNSWFNVNPPTDPFTAKDINILNSDTIWVVSDNSLTGGVFFTSNGGLNWQNQLNIGSQNPTNIYMYNKDTGFTAENTLYRTTNGGISWILVPGGTGFSDMYFINGTTGWKCYGPMQKTTNGGLNWVNLPIPEGGNILGNGAIRFMNKDDDTIWAVGETLITGGNPLTRGILFRTVNGGMNWQYQLPDTAIHINRYLFGQFLNKRIGWAYSFNPTGIHTSNGGDTTFYTGLQLVSNEIPKQFLLYQNYPNPFNPKTIIRYDMKREMSNVRLVVYDITGKEIITLVNKEQRAGTYEVDFSGGNLSSGVYFYKLTVSTGKEVFTQTKKMALIK
jgi:hypothetical protein